MGYAPDPITGKPIYDEDISDPVGQFQAAADFAEDQTSITVATFNDLQTITKPRPGMLAWISTTDQVARYNGTSWAIAGGVAVDATASLAPLTGGWTIADYCSLVRLPSGHVLLTVEGVKDAAINPNGDGLLRIPTGFRPAREYLFAAAEWTSGLPTPITASVRANGDVIAFGSGSSTHRTVSFSATYKAVV